MITLAYLCYSHRRFQYALKTFGQLHLPPARPLCHRPLLWTLLCQNALPGPHLFEGGLLFIQSLSWCLLCIDPPPSTFHHGTCLQKTEAAFPSGKLDVYATFIVIPLLVAAILGALYLITLIYLLLFTFGPGQLNFLWALALVAYLAFVSIIAGVRAKARHWELWSKSQILEQFWGKSQILN